MANDHDLDLRGMFAESPMPAEDAAFLAGVTKRITMRRYSRWAFKILLAVLAVLMAGLMGFTGCIAMGSNLFAQVVIALFISPAGLAIGGGAGLFIFMRTR